MTLAPLLLASGISLGSVLLCYYRVSRRAYTRLERAYGELIDGLSRPERENFILEKFIKATHVKPFEVEPSFTNFHYGGWKLFAKKHGIDLKNLIKNYELKMDLMMMHNIK